MISLSPSPSRPLLLLPSIIIKTIFCVCLITRWIDRQIVLSMTSGCVWHCSRDDGYETRKLERCSFILILIRSFFAITCHAMMKWARTSRRCVLCVRFPSFGELHPYRVFPKRRLARSNIIWLDKRFKRWSRKSSCSSGTIRWNRSCHVWRKTDGRRSWSSISSEEDW